MSRDPEQFDFFVSYARNDNTDGWVTRFVAEPQRFQPFLARNSL
jgi:hypothetical protein